MDMTRPPISIRLASLVAVLLLVAAACTSADNTAGTTTAPTTTATAPTTTAGGGAADTTVVPTTTSPEAVLDPHCPVVPPAAATTIDMMGWEFPIMSVYADELRECEAIGNTTINVQLLDSAGAQDQTLLDLSTGSPSFEIIHGDNGFLARLAAEGRLLALDDLIAKYRDRFELDGILQSFWDLATIDGKIYGVPLVGNTMHLFYNPEILDAAGVAVPNTYDDVIAACPTLKQAGFDVPFTMNLHAGWAWRIEFTNFIKSFGGNILNQDSTPAWNSPEGVAAANKMVEVVNACMGAEGLAFSIDDSQSALQTAELPMASIWASRAAAMDDPEASTVVGVIQFAPALFGDPIGKRNGPAFADFYAIPAGTDVDPDFIFQLIAAAADLESQTVAAKQGIVSRGITVEGGPRDSDAAAVSIEEGVGSDTIDPALSIANSALGTWLIQIPEGISVEDALANAEADYIAEATAQGFLGG